MADDTAALVVALSAQITKFEKDLQKAVGIADQKTKQIENSFSRANKSINTQLSLLASSFSNRLGGAGAVLNSFGKAGIAAAVGIGAAVVAISRAVQITSRFIEQADRLDQSAQNIGVTITQLKALGEAGKAANQDFERTDQAFVKFIGNVEALKEASGPLYEALRKTDQQLLLQLTNARNSAEAIDVLVKAFTRLKTESEKVALARAAGFTRGGVGTLQEIADRGGFLGLTKGKEDIDAATKELAKLKNEVERLEQVSFDVVGAWFSKEQLLVLKGAHILFQSIVSLMERAKGLGPIQFAPPAGTQTRGGVDEAGFISAFGGLGVPLPRDKPVIAPPRLQPTPEQELDNLRRLASVMGDAISLADQYRLKQAELAVAIKEKVINEDQAERALVALNIAQKIAIVAALERLGIADKEAIVAGKLREIEQQRIKIGLTQQQVIEATALAMKEANEEADRLAVRRAMLPGLKQLELDAKNVNKAMDDLAVGSLNKLTDSLADVVTGTRTVKEAFGEMIKFIAAELAKLAIRQAIIGPLAGFFGGAGGAGFPGLQHGTSHWGGGWTWVGEKGPELVNLPKGSQVVPNEVARGGVGGVSVGVTSTIVVQGDASERTLMLIEGALARQKRELPNDIIKTVQQMQSRRVA